MELNITRNNKDVVFIDLFERNKKALLELFNFFNGTNYDDESTIDIVTIKDSLFVTNYNDLAFIFANVISLYEHQSTMNPNMPLRLLCYLAEEYQVIVNKNKRSIYGQKQVTIPTPKFYIFYNGLKEEKDMDVMKLSNLYGSKNVTPDLDLSVTFVNINFGHNKELMENCTLLEEYSKFVDIVHNNPIIDEDEDVDKHTNDIIDYCIDKGILKEYLKERRDFVLGSLIREFDQEKYDNTIRMDAYDEGREEGIQEGRAETLKYLINLSPKEREAILSLTPDEITKKISEIK